MSKYEVKKQGFADTKGDREEQETAKNREKLLAKVNKLELDKAEQEFDALKRSTFLAPHQHERRRFLEQAIAILKRQAADKEDLAAKDVKPTTDASLEPVVSTKRSRHDDSSDDEHDAPSNSQRRLDVGSSAWSNVLSAPSRAVPQVPHVMQPIGTPSFGGGDRSTLAFVPRTVVKHQNRTQNDTSTDAKVLNRPHPTTDDAESFLDDIF